MWIYSIAALTLRQIIRNSVAYEKTQARRDARKRMKASAKARELNKTLDSADNVQANGVEKSSDRPTVRAEQEADKTPNLTPQVC